MGFTTGFAGGVTLTLSLAYLAVLTHQRNRQAQSDVLRAQTYILNALATDPATALAHQTRGAAHPRREEHHSLVDAAKERWNAELEGAVRWVQTTDWSAAREDAEHAVLRLLRGSGATQQAQQASDAIASAARDATGRAAGSLRSAAGEAKTGAVRVAETVQDKSGEATEQAAGLLAQGLGKGRELVGRARTAVGLAEDKVEGAVSKAVLPPSDVEKALSQRYGKSDAMSRSVEEVIGERYKPLDERDNTRLRGI